MKSNIVLNTSATKEAGVIITHSAADTENTLADDHPVIKLGENETKSQATLTNRLGKIAINLPRAIQMYVSIEKCYN